MKPVVKILVGGCSLLALSACARTNGQKAVDEAKQAIADQQKSTDEAIENARKAGRDAQKTAAEIYEKNMDSNAYGSQPAVITLQGALVDGVKPQAQTTIQQTPGTSWRGVKPELQSDVLVLEKDAKGPEALPADGVINLGCDVSKFPEAKGLATKEPLSSDFAIVANAKLVIVCDGKLLGQRALTIRAAKLILSDAISERSGGNGTATVEIAAGELVLRGKNKIGTYATDASTTFLSSAPITIYAKTVSGAGTLTLETVGSSYREPKPATDAKPATEAK